MAQRIAEMQTTEYRNPAAISPALPDEMFEAYLGVGSDASGVLADAILLALAPTDGSAPILVSIPRDLYVRNPCHEGWSRINAGLGGCEGFASGTELIALMVQGYTGIEVDHVARVTFDGFASVVNALGGVNVCTDNPARDPRSGLDLPGGCVVADGYTTLAWVRSRHTEQFIDGTWQVVAGSDFSRQSQAARCAVSAGRQTRLLRLRGLPRLDPGGGGRSGPGRLGMVILRCGRDCLEVSGGDQRQRQSDLGLGARFRHFGRCLRACSRPDPSTNSWPRSIHRPRDSRAIGQDRSNDESDRDRPGWHQDRGSRPGYRRHRAGPTPASPTPSGDYDATIDTIRGPGRGDGCVLRRRPSAPSASGLRGP